MNWLEAKETGKQVRSVEWAKSDFIEWEDDLPYWLGGDMNEDIVSFNTLDFQAEWELFEEKKGEPSKIEELEHNMGYRMSYIDGAGNTIEKQIQFGEYFDKINELTRAVNKQGKEIKALKGRLAANFSNRGE